MKNLTLISGFIVFILVVLLSSCDTVDLNKKDSNQPKTDPIFATSTQFAQLREGLNETLNPNSLDAVYVALSERFDGFGGMYLDENCCVRMLL